MDAHKKEWQRVNEKAMYFLKSQIHTGDNSTFQAGRLFGCCEALCMAGVITADQWAEIDNLNNAPVAEAVKVN